MEECACFYYEYDRSDSELNEVCTCGHQIDEHDDDGDCKAMVG